MIVRLMHNNEDIAVLNISDETGTILHYKCNIPEKMPFMREMSLKEINEWWKERAIPEKRSGVNKIIEKAECDTPLLYQAKNLALSLSDCYWVCPIELDLDWKDVNLYDNTKKATFKSENGDEFGNNPNNSLNGSMDKEAIFKDGIWLLKKYKESSNGQQCVNEKFAGIIHERQGFKEYTNYELQVKEGKVESCTCPFFTSKDHEFITAYNFVQTAEKNKSISPYEEYISQCVKSGLDEKYVRDFMDYQTLVDFLMTNDDRHYNNFGVIRDTASLKIVSLAPLFDSGNSMFWKQGYSMTAFDILSQKITSMAQYEEKMLEYVKNKDIVNIEKLPSPQETIDIYTKHGVDEKTATCISKNYDLKIQMLNQYQKGFKVSRYFVKNWDAFISQNNIDDDKVQDEEKEGSDYDDI